MRWCARGWKIMEDLELRSFVECRAEASSGGRKIHGYAIVFDRPSQEIPFPDGRGSFIEYISRDAVDRTLNEGLDVRALVDHDTTRVIGRTRAGTLTLRKDGRGLRAEIEPDEEISYARDITRAVARGDVSGMSFRFKTMPGGDAWNWNAKIPERTVNDMIIREVSIVTFPAYLDANAAIAMRSLDAAGGLRSGNRLEWLSKWQRTKLAR